MPKKTVENATDLVKAMGDLYGAALRQPKSFFDAYYAFGQDVVKSLTGTADVVPERGDKRFADPIWQTNPAYRALMQSYLSWAQNLNSWVDGLDVPQRTKLRAKLLAGMMTDSLAPTNMLLGNPQALKTTLEQGGSNLVSGAQNFIMCNLKDFLIIMI